MHDLTSDSENNFLGISSELAASADRSNNSCRARDLCLCEWQIMCFLWFFVIARNPNNRI